MQKLLKEAYKIAIFRGNYENRRQLAFLKIVTKGAKKSLPLFLCLIFFGGMFANCAFGEQRPLRFTKYNFGEREGLFANYAFRKREVLSENYAFRKQNPTVCELRFLQTKTTCLRVTLSANKAHLSANYAFRKQKPTCLRITLFANKTRLSANCAFLQTKTTCLRVTLFVNKARLPANYAFRKQSLPACELHLS